VAKNPRIASKNFTNIPPDTEGTKNISITRERAKMSGSGSGILHQDTILLDQRNSFRTRFLKQKLEGRSDAIKPEV
jgi:hypothetical protein